MAILCAGVRSGGIQVQRWCRTDSCAPWCSDTATPLPDLCCRVAGLPAGDLGVFAVPGKRVSFRDGLLTLCCRFGKQRPQSRHLVLKFATVPLGFCFKISPFLPIATHSESPHGALASVEVVTFENN